MACDLLDPAYINEVLQLVVDDLCVALEECTTAGAPKSCFISWTAPPDDCCDFLAVWMDELLPTVKFPVVNSTDPFQCGVSRMMRVKARLVRPCWPVVRDNAKSPFPPPADIQAAAEALLIDSNVVWCRLVSAFANNFYQANETDCLMGMINNLKPDPPRGGCAGFTATWMMELDSCRC